MPKGKGYAKKSGAYKMKKAKKKDKMKKKY